MLSLFEMKRASVLFSRKILTAIYSFTKERIFLIPLCIAFSIPKILGFRSLRKVAYPGE